MLKKTFKTLLIIFSLCAVLALGVALQLSRGPINLSFLIPYLKDEFSVDLKIGALKFNLQEKTHHPTFILEDLIAETPEVGLHVKSLSAKLKWPQLLKGNFIFTKMEAKEAELDIDFRSMGDPRKRETLHIFNLQELPIKRIHFSNVFLGIQLPEASKINAQIKDFSFEKGTSTFKAGALLNLGQGPLNTPIEMNLSAPFNLSRFKATFKFKNLNAHRVFAFFPSAQMPNALKGYNQSFEGQMTLRGSFNDAKNLNFHTLIQYPVTYEMPGQEPIHEKVDIQFDGSFEASGTKSTVKVKGKSGAFNLKTLNQLWPQGIGDSAKLWMLANMPQGIAGRATINLGAVFDEISNSLDIHDIGGEIDIDGATVSYIEGMPSVKNVDARATYNHQRFNINILKGHISNVTIQKGYVNLIDLDQDLSRGDILLTLGGPLPEVMAIADHPPLKYGKKYGFTPSQLKGKATLDLGLNFPLQEKIKLEDVDVKVKATIADGFLPGIVDSLQMDLSEGNLALYIDNNGLDLEGTCKLKGLSSHLKWHEFFNPQPKGLTSKYAINLTTDISSLNFILPDTLLPYLDGSISLKVDIDDLEKGRQFYKVFADLKNVRLHVPYINAVKPKGVPAAANIFLQAETGQLSSILTSTLSSPILEASFSGHFGSNGRLKHFNIHSFKDMNNDFSMSVHMPEEGPLKFRLVGEYLDGKSFIKEIMSQEAETSLNSNTLIDIEVAILRLALDSTHYFSNLMINSQLQGFKDIVSLSLKTFLNDGKDPIYVRVEENPQTDQSKISARFPDFGALLKIFDITDTVSTGPVSIIAYKDKQLEDGPISGTIKAQNLRIKNAPVLLHLFSIVALEGIVNALSGEGLNFIESKINFKYANKHLYIERAKATSISIGIALAGNVNFQEKTLDIKGTFIPIYALNKFLSNIPVIGIFISGGKEESGVFSAAFKIKGPFSDPKIESNPLEVFAPGFIKELFFAENQSTLQAKATKEYVLDE